MAKYRKKPVVIDAFQWFREMSVKDTPDWFYHAWIGGKVRINVDGTGIIAIETLEGTHLSTEGDYIIRGVKGELYPCKPDIFEMTYEPVCEDEGSGNKDSNYVASTNIDEEIVKARELILPMEHAIKLKAQLEQPTINITANASKEEIVKLCGEIEEYAIMRWKRKYGIV
ncbi:MAG: hypothetical protein ACRDBM_03670 [Sporomusa sp.]